MLASPHRRRRRAWFGRAIAGSAGLVLAGLVLVGCEGAASREAAPSARRTERQPSAAAAPAAERPQSPEGARPASRPPPSPPPPASSAAPTPAPTPARDAAPPPQVPPPQDPTIAPRTPSAPPPSGRGAPRAPEPPPPPAFTRVLARFKDTEPASVRATRIDDQQLVIVTENVQRLFIDRGDVPLDTSRSIALMLDGQPVEWLSTSKVTEFERSVNGKWSPVRPPGKP